MALQGTPEYVVLLIPIRKMLILKYGNIEDYDVTTMFRYKMLVLHKQFLASWQKWPQNLAGDMNDFLASWVLHFTAQELAFSSLLWSELWK